MVKGGNELQPHGGSCMVWGSTSGTSCGLSLNAAQGWANNFASQGQTAYWCCDSCGGTFYASDCAD